MHLAKTFAATLLLASAALAQTQIQPQGRVYTADDYARAERFMNYNVNPLVLHTVTEPAWLPDGRVWYRDRGANGTSYILVDPAHASKAPAFDQAKLATALTAAMHAEPALDPQHLPIQAFNLADKDQTVAVVLHGKRFDCDLSGSGVCKSPEPAAAPNAKPSGGPPETSPDGRRAAFIRDWNLWLRDLNTGKETPLTRDGVPNYGYATDNAGWTHSDHAILVWSPDSQRIATFQQDQRKTGEVYLTNVVAGHPELATLKNPLPGDKDVTMIERVVIDLGAKAEPKPRIVRLKMAPDQHRSSLCDDISCQGSSGWDDVQWSADSKSLAFVSTSRDHKQEWMRLANPETGDVREVMGETVPTFFESGNGRVNWRYLSKSNELLWFSERDNWGQLYLYDIASGKLKHPITRGDGNVTQVLGVDEDQRTLYFLAVGKEPSLDPYYQLFYSVNFDGNNLKLLTPEPADHTITLSPDRKFFVDTYSTPTKPQMTVLRDSGGNIVQAIAHQDISRLVATGWQPPVPIMVKARDRQTDLYGLLFRPTNFSTDAKYPVVDLVYPGPQQGSCGAPNGSRSFTASHRDMQALAELGFIVVCIDGMGTPGRSKAFHTAAYGNMADYTIPDQVAGIRDLGARYPWIDLDRVGIWGHSGGGAATAAAMFRFPDFFKVGISESGNHDNRVYEDDWGEKYQGLLVSNADGTDNYTAQANQTYAKDLKGHLLLMHGTADDNVPPVNTLLVVDALIKANKDFDLVMIPNAQHGYAAAAQYAMRRRWDYFVRYLGGGTPPHEYEMKPYAEIQKLLAP
ncbi:prolyl oligopeptidase family serine peptidase [Granulicella sp. WH15]|uniref:S9 family peptidase n=1 Tax=Granulicella sp. WH15 TaxID=2602070 RepID=UPI001366A785|nr:DPP IV N-terminal domain-containing protein [Granulicella sp. WH15]QHN02015.1 prolyl oligopeptidase family serine peptidase [Granulicella sp. WH15]